MVVVVVVVVVVVLVVVVDCTSAVVGGSSRAVGGTLTFLLSLHEASTVMAKAPAKITTARADNPPSAQPRPGPHVRLPVAPVKSASDAVRAPGERSDDLLSIAGTGAGEAEGDRSRRARVARDGDAPGPTPLRRRLRAITSAV